MKKSPIYLLIICGLFYLLPFAYAAEQEPFPINPIFALLLSSSETCGVYGGDNSNCTYDCFCVQGGSNDSCGNCDGGKIEISGSISLDNSSPLDFSLTVDGKQIGITHNSGFSLVQDSELETNYYEILAYGGLDYFFRLRLPENISSEQIYTNPKISSLHRVFDNFTLYLWDDSAKINYYSFNNSYCSRMIIEVAEWDFDNNRIRLSFSGEMLSEYNCR